MKVKKIILIVLLVGVIGVVGFVLLNSNEKKDAKSTNQNTSLAGKRGGSTTEENSSENKTEEKSEEVKSTGKVTITNLSDGTLYSATNDEIKPDIVIGDNFYDTQIADINLNFSQYEGKIIEIEGMYLTSNTYDFVGRYSNSNLCPTCPPGYSYFEYQMDEEGAPDFRSEGAWIKVVGTLKKDYDEEYDEDYYYIDVLTIEEMNEWGMDTVNN